MKHLKKPLVTGVFLISGLIALFVGGPAAAEFSGWCLLVAVLYCLLSDS